MADDKLRQLEDRLTALDSRLARLPVPQPKALVASPANSLASPANHPNPPHSGPALIGIGALAALAGLFLLAALPPLGMLALWAASVLTLGGTIRWAVAGVRLTQVEQVQQQQAELLALLREVLSREKFITNNSKPEA